MSFPHFYNKNDLLDKLADPSNYQCTTKKTNFDILTALIG